MTATETRLAQYRTAETAVLGGQRFRYLERDWTMPDLAEIRKAIKDLEAQVAIEARGASGVIGLPTVVAGFNPGYCGGTEGDYRRGGDC